MDQDDIDMEHISQAKMAQAIKSQNLNYVVANRNTFISMTDLSTYFGSLLLTQYAYYLTGQWNALLSEACEEGHCDIVDWLLLNKQSNVLHKDVLSLPVVNGHINVALSLIKAGAEINGEGSLNPLISAVVGNKIDIIYQLYIYGADMSFSFAGNNALHYACYRNYYDIVEALLNLGVPNVPNDEGLLPIDIAIDQKIKALLE